MHPKTLWDVLRPIAVGIGAALVLAALALPGAFRPSPAQGQADVFSAFLTQFKNRFPNIGSYPPGATPLRASSGDVAAVTATATLPGAPALFTHILGFDITGGGANGATNVVCTVADGTWTLTYDLQVPAGPTAGITPYSQRFPEPIPASAVNTSIVVSCPTFGAGNLHAAVSAYGYQTAATP